MATKYVTQTGAGAKDGAAWDSAYDLAAVSWAAGNTYYFGDSKRGCENE